MHLSRCATPTIRAGLCVNQLSDLTGPPKIDGVTQTAFDMTSPLRSRWDQEGAEFVQSNNEWCARGCARLLALNSQLEAADTLQLVQEWSLKDGPRSHSG